MSNTTGPSSLGGANANDSISRMENAFNFAIEQSARITELSTVKKAELDAAKQRPQG
jgi:hypothetical protein